MYTKWLDAFSLEYYQDAILIIIATFPVDVATYTGSEFFCDISRQQCDISRQWGLRRFQQIATFLGDCATFSVDYDISRRCDISRRYSVRKNTTKIIIIASRRISYMNYDQTKYEGILLHYINSF